MIKPKIWYVSFSSAQPKRRRVRGAQTFDSEDKAKQFARDTLASGAVIYAGTINPHAPKRFISPDKIDEWLNAVQPVLGDPLI
jgi:hypothetical protein